MLKKLKTIMNTMILSAMLLAPFILATPAHAQLFSGSKEEACRGANLQDAPCSADQATAAQTQINTVIDNAIGILSIIVGVVSVIMLMIGGFKYITSSGDSNNVNSAKNTILYAIIGLAVAAMAQVISRLVVGKF